MESILISIKLFCQNDSPVSPKLMNNKCQLIYGDKRVTRVLRKRERERDLETERERENPVFMYRAKG